MAAIENKIVWITGASGGIGEGLVYALAQKNCKLILSARNEENLNRVKNNCNNQRIEILPLDLIEFDQASNHVEKAISFYLPFN